MYNCFITQSWKWVTVKCIDPLHVKNLCITVMCSTVLHNKNKAIQHMCAYLATRLHFYFFCSFNCFKKILNVKILKWKFCRKTLILSSVWLQSPSPISTAPSAYSQGPVPNCWVSMQNDCNKAPTSDCSREHLAPLWPQNVQFRWFWSQTY